MEDAHVDVGHSVVRHEARAVSWGGEVGLLRGQDGGLAGPWLQPPPPFAPAAASGPGGQRLSAEPGSAPRPRQRPARPPPAAPAAPGLRRLVVLDQQEAEQAQQALERVEDGGEHQAALVVLQLAAFGGRGAVQGAAGARRAGARGSGAGSRARDRGGRARGQAVVGVLAFHQGHRVAVDHRSREGAEDPEHEDQDAQEQQVLAVHPPPGPGGRPRLPRRGLRSARRRCGDPKSRARPSPGPGEGRLPGPAAQQGGAEQGEAGGQQQPGVKGARGRPQPERLPAQLRAQREALEADGGGAERAGEQQAGGERGAGPADAPLHPPRPSRPAPGAPAAARRRPRRLRLLPAPRGRTAGLLFILPRPPELAPPPPEPASSASRRRRRRDPAPGTEPAQSTARRARPLPRPRRRSPDARRPHPPLRAPRPDTAPRGPLPTLGPPGRPSGPSLRLPVLAPSVSRCPAPAAGGRHPTRPPSPGPPAPPPGPPTPGSPAFALPSPPGGSAPRPPDWTRSPKKPATEQGQDEVQLWVQSRLQIPQKISSHAPVRKGECSDSSDRTFRGLPPAAPPWPAVPGVDDSGRLRSFPAAGGEKQGPGAGTGERWRERACAPAFATAGSGPSKAQGLSYLLLKDPPKPRAVLPGEAAPVCLRQRRGPRPSLLEATCCRRSRI